MKKNVKKLNKTKQYISSNESTDKYLGLGTGSSAVTHYDQCYEVI
jgi:hypothetical protein